MICIFANNDFSIILGRVFQGLGVGASALTGPALMADCFKGRDLTRVSSYYSTVYGLIPISAPVLGGYIQDFLGWRYNFVFMLALAVIIYVIFVLKLPETLDLKKRATFSLPTFFKNYWVILKVKQFLLSVICLLLTWSMFIIFSVMAPFIMQERLGFSASIYGLQAIFVGLGFFIGNNINTLLMRVYRDETILLIGLGLMSALSVLLLIFPLAGLLNAWTIILPIFFIMLGAGLAFPHLYAAAVSAIPRFAGAAGALIGTLILIGAVIITSLMTLLHAHSALSMAAVYLILSFSTFSFYLFGIKKD